MDPITHAAAGIGLASLSGSKFSICNPLYISSLVASIAPDLDILYRFKGEIAYLKNHRGFSHSIPGLLCTAVLTTALLNIFYPDFSPGLIFLWAVIGALSHTALDLFNSYGVKIFLPFSRRNYSFNLLLIFDPVLMVVFLSLFYLSNSANLSLYSIPVPIGFLLAYLLFRVYVQQRIKAYLGLKYRKRNVSDIIVFPSLFSLFTWNFILETPEEYLIGEIKTYPRGFGLLRKLKKRAAKRNIIDKALNSKLGRLFKEFTPYFYVYSFEKNGMHFVKFLDLRYFNGSDFLHTATAVFDDSFKLIDSIFHPFRKNNNIRIVDETLEFANQSQ